MQEILCDLFDILKGSMLLDDAIYAIRLQCYFAFLTRQNEYDFNFLDFSNHQTFNEIILNETVKHATGKANELLKDIIVSNSIMFCETLNISYKLLSELDAPSLLYIFENSERSLKSGINTMSVNSTEQEIIDLICMLNKNASIDTIMDLCSGTGAFLSTCSKKFKNVSLFGIEINDKNYLLSRLRLEMNRAKYSIKNEDVLRTEMSEKYDLVFCNYPWMLRYTKEIKKDSHALVDFVDVKQRADWAFVSKAINNLEENGRAFLVMPNGCLFSLIESKYRQILVENNLVEMIVSLPNGTISKPNVSCSLVVFSKNNEKIKMVNGIECFVKVGTQASLDVEKLVHLIELEEKNVKWIDKAEVISNEYNLDVSRYFIKKVNIPCPKPLWTVAETFRGFQYSAKEVIELKPGQGEYSVVKISDLNGLNIKYSDLVSMNVPKEKVAKYLLKENDVLLTTKGTALNVGVVKNLGGRKVIPSANLTVIRVKDESIIPLYLYIFLKSETGGSLLKSVQTSSTIISISKKGLDDLNIPAIDLKSQASIVQQFRGLNARIMEMKEKIALLEEKVSALYEIEVGE